jgi:hypothetical protein
MKMINKLIERTTEKEFYQRGYFRIIDFKGHYGDSKTTELNLLLNQEDDYGSLHKIENWQLVANQTIELNNISSDLYLPYVKLEVLEEHPLLWTYTKSLLECELIGYPQNTSEFLGDLYFEYEKVTGNWIPLNKTFFNINDHYKKNGKMKLLIQEPLMGSIEKVSEKHGIGFKVTKEIKGHIKGHADRPKVKLLIFVNEHISLSSFNMGQPYIIADEFAANLI